MKIGVIDSGLGGISTLAALLKILPDEDYIYAADRSFMPYGNKPAELIAKRIEFISRALQSTGVKALVIACNTATAAGIEYLRKSLPNVVCVGVEPAVKPACDELTFGKALVLLTPSAARQPKLRALLEPFKDKIIVSPQPFLAGLVEKNINDLSKIKGDIAAVLCAHRNENVESIVLGCTHYCLIKAQIQSLTKAKIYDGNIGTAVRLRELLKSRGSLSRKGGFVEFITF